MDAKTRPDAFSVSQLNEYIKMLLEGNPNLSGVWVQGEISGAKLYGSGHLYFSLKDSDSVISAVMFRGSASKLKFSPESGMKVLARGRVSAYVPRGQYQLIVEDMIPDGAGELAVAFEQLKARLAAEEKKLIGEIERLEKKLSNEGFVAKAPAAVVEGEKVKLAKYRENLDGIRAAIAKLK